MTVVWWRPRSIVAAHHPAPPSCHGGEQRALCGCLSTSMFCVHPVHLLNLQSATLYYGTQITCGLCNNNKDHSRLAVIVIKFEKHDDKDHVKVLPFSVNLRIFFSPLIFDPQMFDSLIQNFECRDLLSHVRTRSIDF